ncbi:tRNA (adenosine(37)-N6)-threonylcarbamoyltransferase complex transferase subunit TsaD [Rubellicoccus peritrichatus]|uniref:tRNA N6-adenosine threonylcarbamoyltransferase n=1 Tax=Rubellicoccus peritrichatus TaxID=3080537 RepID=A0AAQ3LAJ8_9BACT|nr:tRNA (adenosine(37)-N6)-threonylcarbamoyltransferase complex transferase subunit TsaD [Puniceicoccus sp. CR14]WOO39958.1 tRNA (adenosine(37)-N6)-threonylcarbamoyltransferase complex transferase subunit TsaD [Puniceicoccus sp. CR14]
MLLAIESSCDESAIAVFDPQSGIIGEWVHSQIALHKEYGGVVPDLASREHLERFGPMLEKIADTVDLTLIKQICVTVGPGLAGCLAMGIATARALSLVLDVPVVGVNHLRGHVFSPFISLHKSDPDSFSESIESVSPHLGLLVSGGNTLLFSLDDQRRISILAQTVDDAAGEALDKGAKLLGMPYPGGPLMEKRASTGNSKAIKFPTGIAERGDWRFSFSGLKTSLRYRIEKLTDEALEAEMPDICASYQEAVVRQLVRKTSQALKEGQFRSLGLSGGVANNTALRQAMENLAKKFGVPLFAADRKHTGDNAAMIAFAAWINQDGLQQNRSASPNFEPSLKLV